MCLMVMFPQAEETTNPVGEGSTRKRLCVGLDPAAESGQRSLRSAILMQCEPLLAVIADGNETTHPGIPEYGICG